MARIVLPIAGAIVGAAFGAPQIGFAIGSIIGNAVDPIEVQGNKLGDAPTQVAAEGGARAIVFGKGCIRATVILERGGRRVIRQRESAGKGSGPTTVNERALWTFAIGLGEAIHGGAVLRIWENEKLVYDITPESQIVADSVKFAERFRFYDGADDQLPDPAIEAIYDDPEGAPYYRGTAYMVFPDYDLTDFGEAVPTYRVEVANESEPEVGDVHVGPYVPATLENSAGPVMWLNGDNPLIVTSYASWVNFSEFVWVGQSYRVTEYGLDFIEDGHTDITNTGLPAYPIDQRIAVLAINGIGGALCTGGNFPSIARFSNGVYAADLRPTVETGQNWYGGAIEQQMAFNQTGYAWLIGGYIYLGVIRTGISVGTVHNKIYRWSAAASGISGASATLEVEPTSVASGVVFMMTVSRQSNVYVYRYSTGEITGYDEDFDNPAALPIPAVVQAWPADQFVGFGVDEYLGVACFVRRIAGGISQSVVVADLAGEVIATVELDSETNNSKICKVVFSNSGAVIQIGQRFYRLEISTGGSQASVMLGTIVAALHERCGHASADYDVTELSELINGVVIESTVTAAEAVNSIIGCHFADPSDYDGKIHYVKRGKPVVKTLTADDLIDEPESAQRNNAIEYPRKAHFLAQRADLAYAASKSTSARYSADAKVVGEASYTSPETFSDPQAPAEIAVKLHKVLWTEAEGERVWHVTDEHLDLVPSDSVGLSYRGELVRCRITQIEDDPGQRKLKMIRDRQSAYTATLTEIPNPVAPTPPQSSIVAPTVLAVMDLPALTDNADTLHYYAAMSGENDNWTGAVLQQSLDGGASFATVGNATLNAIIGKLQNSVTSSSGWYTDETNEVIVKLFTDETLESRSEVELLNGGGAFALAIQLPGDPLPRGWEIMQFRDAEEIGPKTWKLTGLHRGMKNTSAISHSPGDMFVLLDTALLRQAAETSWVALDWDHPLVHRGVSNGLSPESADIVDSVFMGESQREWHPAGVTATRAGGVVSATVTPRQRFGTPMNPIQSANLTGYYWTVSTYPSAEPLAEAETGANELSVEIPVAWPGPVVVFCTPRNRLVGLGSVQPTKFQGEPGFSFAIIE